MATKRASARDAGSNRALGVLRSLYEAYFPTLVKGLRATYGDGPPEPEDIAQQAFERLGRREDLDSIASLENYVWITARNILVSELRRAQVRESNARELNLRFLTAAVDEFDPERVSIAGEQLELISKALEALPVKTQRIFVLNRIQGLNSAAIARQLGMGRTTVNYHLGKASEALYRAVEGDSGSRGQAER